MALPPYGTMAGGWGNRIALDRRRPAGNACRKGRAIRRRVMALPTYGTMAVDWENRIDFDRLRRERLARAKDLLVKSEMGALLCFDMNNVRYITATHIGTWAQDKANRFTLLPQNDEPILWDLDRK